MPPTLEAPKRLKEHSLAADLRFNPQGRRRPTFLVASALLVVVCGASFAAAYGRAGHQTSVLAVSTMVPQGAVIVPSDLASVHISLTPSIRTIPASDASSVIGRTATVGLVAGSILVDSDFASTSSPPSGDAFVGIALKPGQLPASGLSPGQRVDIVLTGVPGSPDADTGEPPGEANTASDSPGVVLAAAALVQDVELPSSATGSDSVAVTVAVNADVAPFVANAAVSGQLALVVVGSGS